MYDNYRKYSSYNKNLKKIVIIGCYFGKLPNYFDYWLLSCEKNHTINFYIFTDQNVKTCPKNVKVEKYSLEKISKLATEKLGLEINIKTYYKMCDFKPIYGLIFEDYIKDFEFWGHCDFDMIFGDLRFFFKDSLLNNFDKILDLGHLTLYKNETNVKNAFKLKNSEISYKTVFLSEKNFAFDEKAINIIFRENKLREYVNQNIFLDILVGCKRLSLKKFKDKKNQVFYWENGKIYREYIEKNKNYKEEYLYIHFQKRKIICNTNIEKIKKGFYISKNGIKVKNNDQITKKIIMENNRYDGLIIEQIQKINFKIKYMLKTSSKINYIKKLFVLK